MVCIFYCFYHLYHKFYMSNRHVWICLIELCLWLLIESCVKWATKNFKSINDESLCVQLYNSFKSHNFYWNREGCMASLCRCTGVFLCDTDMEDWWKGLRGEIWILFHSEPYFCTFLMHLSCWLTSDKVWRLLYDHRLK